MVFDIGISGPIAGFFPAVFFSLYGLYQSEIVNMKDVELGLSLGEPLIFKAMVYWVLGPFPRVGMSCYILLLMRGGLASLLPH